MGGKKRLEEKKIPRGGRKKTKRVSEENQISLGGILLEKTGSKKSVRGGAEVTHMGGAH